MHRLIYVFHLPTNTGVKTQIRSMSVTTLQLIAIILVPELYKNGIIWYSDFVCPVFFTPHHVFEIHPSLRDR